MQIFSGVRFAMLNKDIVAVGSGSARGDNPTITHRKNGCASRCGIINSAMRFYLFGDGVHATKIKARADASKKSDASMQAT